MALKNELNIEEIHFTIKVMTEWGMLSFNLGEYVFSEIFDRV